MQAPPPIPKRQSSDWVSRHWKWLVAVFCLGAVIFVTGICGFVMLMVKTMKSSSVYSDALERAKSAPLVATVLGTPLKDGFFFAGNISEYGDSSGSARFMIPVSGPKGSGHLSVSATRSLGAWHYDELTLLVDKTQERIDLLSTNQQPLTAR